MPTGRLRAGHIRVAGVATVEAMEELHKLMVERGLASLSQAVGAALQEWLALVRRRVANPGTGNGVLGPGIDRLGVVNSVLEGCKPRGKEEGRT